MSSRSPELMSSPEMEQAEDNIGQRDWEAGKKRLEEYKKDALETGNCGNYAILAAEMSILNQEKAGEAVIIDKAMEGKIKEDLEKRKEEARKGGGWGYYASLAVNINRVNPDIKLIDDEAKDGMLAELEDLKKKSAKENTWYDYVGLLSASTVLNPENTPKPNEQERQAIMMDVMTRNQATDLDYAARARVIFPEATAYDLGVGPDRLVEVEHNAENFSQDGFYKNVNNFFKIKANERILTAKAVNVQPEQQL